jgi:PAS domain S-box-containing protein
MILTIALIISILIQLTAAFLALKLIPITGKSKAWIAIAAGFLFMVFRRGFDFFYLLRGRTLFPYDTENFITELIAITSSLLLAIGVALIAPIFLSLKRSRETIERLRHQNDLILRYSRAGIIELDLKDNHRFVNPSAAHMLGYEAEELMNKSAHKTWHYSKANSTAYSETECPICVACRSGIVREERNEVFWRKDGTNFPVSFICSPIFEDGKIVGSVINFKDITEIKQIEEELTRSNADLKEFAYVTSHDLKEPLRTIAGFAELLKRRYKDRIDEKGNEYIKFIEDEVKRLQNLIGDLLDYSQVGTKEREYQPTECTSLIEKVVISLKTAIEDSGAKVTYDNLPTITADKSQLERLFQNLISNAIKFRSVKPPVIHISAGRKGNSWVFSIRDNGIGIDRKLSEKIFTVFHRLHTRAEYPGTGIGLAICKKVVERHGGQIWVESEPGKGSTFYFSIPDRV